MEGIEATSKNERMTLVLALNYSGKWDILQAVQKVAGLVRDNKIDPGDISEALLQNHLTTQGIPDPELLIRTSGEYRISNFLIWQLAYSELYFTPVFWPDFRKEHFYQALLDYQRRERRFGKISEQFAK
jgi:undecaprenyl diphosphate synthase